MCKEADWKPKTELNSTEQIPMSVNWVTGHLTDKTFKVVSGKYHPSAAPTLDKGSMYETRELDKKDLRLKKSHIKYDIRNLVF